MEDVAGTFLSERRSRWRITMVVSALILGIAIIASACVGFIFIKPTEVVSIILGPLSPGYQPPSPVESAILLQIRVPRVIGAVVVGAALAVSGTVLQDVFSNPLADPFVTGVSSGAAFGAALSIVLGVGAAYLGSDSVVAMAFIGGIVSVAASLLAAGKNSSSTTFLLAGVTVTLLDSAGVAFLTVTAGDRLPALVFWLMGGLSGVDWMTLSLAAPLIVVGLLGTLLLSHDLNALLFGEEQAKSMGVNTQRARILLVALTTLITATAVSVSGIIGFVGLMIPHIMRLLVGPDHRILLPSSILAGGSFLLVSDTLARTILLPIEIPVGIVTATAGGVFFLYLLRHQGRFAIQ